jgi:hypothetical protein
MTESRQRSIALLVAGFFTSVTPIAVIAAVAFLSGAARSARLTCYTTIAFSDRPPDQIRDANTLQATAQQLAVGLGVPAAAVALRAGRPLSHLLRGSVTTGSAYTIAFLLLAVLPLLAAVAAFRLHPDAGSAVTRRSQPEPASATGVSGSG